MFRNKILLFVSGTLLVLLVNLLFAYLYTYYISPDILELKDKEFYFEFGKTYFSILQPVIFYAIAGALLRLVIMWFESEMIRKEAEKKQITGELKLLRSQINPEFVDITLDQIKEQINKHPEEAVSNIDDLAEIMSYMLYETSSEKVPLDDEINYVKNYLALQRSRFKPGCIEFEVKGDASGITVPPLIFMPILEYVFSSIKNPCNEQHIQINISVFNREIKLVTKYTEKPPHETTVFNTSLSFETIRNYFNTLFGDNYSLTESETDGSNLICFKLNE